MNQRFNSFLVICAFIFLCSSSPNASADDCLLGTVWDVDVALPDLAGFVGQFELCFGQNGNFGDLAKWSRGGTAQYMVVHVF